MRAVRKMSVLILVVASVCLAIAAWSWMKPNPRSPPILPGALPFIGHSHQVFGNRKRLWEFIRDFQLYALKNGGSTEFWFGPHSFYALTDPEECLTLANTCLNKPYTYEFAKEFLNNGLITAEASVWKTHRKLLNPSFNQQVLNTYVNEMNVQARSLVSRLASKAVTGPFDVRKFLIYFILSTVTRTSLKLNTEDQVAIDTDYAEAFEEILTIYCARVQRLWLHFSWIFKWSSFSRREKYLMDKLKNIVDPIVHKRKSELKAIKDPINSNETTPDKFKPVLDQMLQLAEEQNAFTDDDIREHLDTLVGASYDTTSSAMTFILLVIGNYQDVQEIIFNELKEALNPKDEDITKEDLQKLVYLEAVMKEAMRLYPVVPFIGRKVDKEVHFKNCTLRAGGSCAIGVYGLLRHPMWGPDAEQFRPERWLDPASLPEHPSLNAVFGVGKRNCIGKQFSMMMMKVALAHIVRRYHITGDLSKVVCEFDVVLKPIEGHHISLTSRI